MVGANHPTKYKQDAARRGRVEGLLRALQAATIRPIYLTTEVLIGIDFTEGARVANAVQPQAVDHYSRWVVYLEADYMSRASLVNRADSCHEYLF